MDAKVLEMLMNALSLLDEQTKHLSDNPERLVLVTTAMCDIAKIIRER